MKAKAWFEFPEVRSRKMDESAWITLRAAKKTESAIAAFLAGYEEEHLALASASIPNSLREAAVKGISWGNLNLMHDDGPSVEDGQYHSSDRFEPHPGDIHGTKLILSQRGSAIEHGEWIVHPDLVLGLHLKREGDVWLAMDEGYSPVIQLHRNASGSPSLIEIRSTHLKDFLAARDEFLMISAYRSRAEVSSVHPPFDWAAGSESQESGNPRWEGSIREITERGHEYGSEMAVFHVGREGFDFDRDVPEIGVSDNFTTRQFTRKFEGKKLFRIEGELWYTEIVNAGANSTRIRGDEIPSQVFFFTDGSGNRESAESLDRKGRWLWFKPDVINKALEFRGSSLGWHTAFTGRISMGPDSGVVFGVNPLGLVNVYAKDIRFSSDWQQRVWAGFNVVPDGKVSRELLMAQAEGEPADTQAPEGFLAKTIDRLNKATRASFGFELIKAHPEHDRLFRVIHRFRAIDETGFYSLAKDLARLIADSVDSAGIQTVVPLQRGEKKGSLKSLEALLSTRVGLEKAHSLMSPLFGVYDLRLADAHLPTSELEPSFNLVRAKREAPWVLQGLALLVTVVTALHTIALALEHPGPQGTGIESGAASASEENEASV